MTYQYRKTLAGQEVVKKLTFKLNKCRFTDSYYTSRELLLVTAGPFSSSYTGSIPSSTVTVGSGYITAWSGIADLYARNDQTGEIVKISISVALSFTVSQRGQFGTLAQTISSGNTFTIYHLGRADGSCYGYSQTCSSPDSYQDGLYKSVIFSTAALPVGSIYQTGIDFKSLSYQSSEIKPGESIGSRSRVSFTIKDQSHDGYDLVFYDDRKSSAGTLFGKLLAWHPYFNVRPVVYSVGLRDSGSLDEPDWEDRELIIDSVNLDDEKFSGSALDPLILTEGKKAKMPIASTAQLTTAITGASTNVVFGNAPAGYFGSSGNAIVRIDSELIEVTANGTTTMPIVTRGFGRSAIKDHQINATVQNCIRFVDEHVIDCITYAIETWTNIPASFIGDYSEAKSLTPTAIISDYVISSPTDVVQFINWCIFVGNLVFYFDDVNQVIVIKYVSEFNLSPIYINENDHIKKNSVRKDLNLKEQYTRFNLSWAPFDLTKDTDDKNFQISLTAINSDMESLNKIGEVNERKSMLLPVLNESSDDYLLGAAAVDRIVSAGREMPEIFECTLDAEAIGDFQGSSLELGSIVNIQSSENQNKAGIGEARLYQLVKISGDPFGAFDCKFKRYQLLEPSEYDFVIEPGAYINYVLTDHFNPVSSGEYLVYIKNGAIFGSYNTAIAAFQTGTPSSGVTFRFIARWQVLGMGGAGGDVSDPGMDGGLAFEANCNCIIDNGAGAIWAGGGGGAGEPYVPPQGPDLTPIPMSGGGGGQGFGESLGGFNTDGISNTTRAPNGNQSGPGIGSGLPGGYWGEDGQRSDSLGGLAGVAIKSNGFSVTIISGDNPLSIRGRRT